MGTYSSLFEKYQVVALNGYRYSIKERFPKLPLPTYFYYNANWTYRTATKVSSKLVSPTILFGFSDGATWAVRIAADNPNIKLVLAHSCILPSVICNCDAVFYRTKGDKTGTFSSTLRAYQNHRSPNKMLFTLDPVPFPGRTVKEVFLEAMDHQFHNANNLITEHIKDYLNGNLFRKGLSNALQEK